MRAIGAMTVVGAIVFACGEDRPLCYPGDFIGCSCANGAYGYSACGEFGDGPAYGPCDCSGAIPGVDAGPPDVAAEAAAKLALFEPCTDAAQCESGVCFEYGDQRSLCSKTCSGASDCPAPSSGCNGKGACKPP